jgi:hypothetical protein
MQRFVTVLALAVLSGLALTGCPDKSATKEEPATPDTPAAADQAGAEEPKAEEKKEEKKEEPAKEEGGW